MALYVYISDTCQQEARMYNQMDLVESIQQKLESSQASPGFDYFRPTNFIKRSLGRSFRLVGYQTTIDNDALIVFLHVYTRSGADYKDFLKKYDTDPQSLINLLPYSPAELRSFCDERRRINPTIPLPPLQQEHIEWLYHQRNQTISDNGYNIIHETDTWVQKMRSSSMTNNLLACFDAFDALTELSSNLSSISSGVCSLFYHQIHKVGIVHVYLPHDNKWVLLDVLTQTNKQDCQTKLSEYQLQLGANLDFANVLRKINIHRAYPDYILLERDYWIAIQADSTANLALSTEETRLLVSLENHTIGYPLFINGRAGSGKSTMLQYLITEYVDYSLSGKTQLQPIYITSSQDLIRRARDTVEKLLTLNAARLIRRETHERSDVTPINMQKVSQTLDNSFVVFHNYLLSMLPPEIQKHFDSTRYIAFTDFCDLWSTEFSRIPNAIQVTKNISPELAWHTIRSYIKGVQSEQDYELSTEEFQALPKKQKSVSQDTYELVFNRVWPWYKSICAEKGYWDDQDLAACVLLTEVAKDQKRGAVFCDEAQDFTPIELEILFQLSVFSQLQIPSPEVLKRVPIVFAGDPLQTINPTGFRWEAVKADFRERFTATLGNYTNSNIDITYKELQFNYRSRHTIVQFCNLIQMVRTILFKGQRIQPQHPWWNDSSNDPVYYVLDTPVTGTYIQENQDIIKLINCEYGKESEYASKDSVLKHLGQSGGVYRNVLGPTRAKGLEFDRVVLYKFATNIQFNLGEIIQKIMNGSTITQESLLPVEYFFNRLYVVASRAKEQLIIVDSQDAFDRFWDFVKDPTNTRKIMDQTGNIDLWKKSIAYPMQITNPKIWSGESITLISQANMYEREGDLNRDPYLLQQAAIAFSYLPGRNPDARRCEAKALIYDDKFTEAGDIYMEIGSFNEAYDCYWKAKNYSQISVLAKTNPLYRAILTTKASQFMTDNNSTHAGALIHGFLAHIKHDHSWLSSVVGDATWHQVVTSLAQCLEKNYSVANQSFSWKDIYYLFEMLFDAGLGVGLQSRALFAYRGGLYLEATHKWEQSNTTNSTQYYDAKARSTLFPHNITWYVRSQNYEAIHSELKNNPHSSTQLIGLDNNTFINIVDMALFVSDLELVVFLLQIRTNQAHVKKLIDLAMRQEKLRQVLDGVCIGISWLITRGEWGQVVDIISIHKLAGIIDDDEAIANEFENLMRTHEWLSLSVRRHAIVALAESESLTNSPRNSAISDYLITTFIKGNFAQACKSHGEIPIEYVGAAIERACRRTDALNFYEALERNNPSPQLKRFTQERQVRCHEWLAEYHRDKSDMREVEIRQNRASKIRQDNHLGGLPFSEYPILLPL